MRRPVRILLCAACLLISGPAALPQEPGTPRINEKVVAELRRRAQSESTLPVVIVLAHQPQRDILDRLGGPSDLRIQIAEGDYTRLASMPLPPPDQLRAARDRADALIVASRQAATAEIQAAIRPQQELMSARLTGLGAKVIARYTMVNMLAAEVPAAALDALELDPDVAEVFPVEAHHVDLNVSGPAFGAPAFWNAGFTGRGLSVAVLDTGIKPDHPAFAGKELVNRVFLQYASGTSCFGDDANSASDKQGHGSHVAGIIASVGPPNLDAYKGVAYGVSTLYTLKIGALKKNIPSCGDPGATAFNTDVYAAIDWALQNTPVKVFNYSYGGAAPQDDNSGARYFDRIVDQYRVIFTISAGNEGPDPRTVGSPGIAYNIISVANSDDHDTVSRNDDDIHYSSSRGPTQGGRFKPDIAAPGTRIFSAAYDSNSFARKTGTSMAAPHVAGAAVLMQQAGITHPLAVKALLINTTDNFGWRPDRGWGYANLERLRAWNNSFTGTLSGGSQPATYFVGSSSGDLTATLAWNRHIPATGPYLNHLGLYLYDRSTNTLLGTSDERLQNVQQVSATVNGGAVLKVKAAEPFATGNPQSEEFGLAVSRAGFVAASGPRLSISCAPPAGIAARSTFSLSCTARNTGDVDAFAVSGSLNLPAGFSQAAPQGFGTLAPGATASRTFSLTAPAAGNYSAQASLSSNFFGESATAETSFSINVGSNAPVLAVSPGALIFSYQVGGAAPAAQNVSVGGSGFAFSASASAAWLRVDPTGGTSPGTVRVSIVPTGLAGGPYSGSVTISASGAANSPQTIPVSLTVTPAGVAGVTVDNKMMTKAVGKPCEVPAPATSFLNSDARAFVWFTVRNAQANDKVTGEWYYPDGKLYQSAAWTPLSSGGNWCFSAGLDIAGAAPAAAPGNWSVKIYWNGAPLFTQPFTITSPVKVENKMLTRSVDTSGCAAPSPASQFAPGDKEAVLWFLVSGSQAGDKATVEWFSPDGSSYLKAEWEPLSSGGGRCFWAWLSIAGERPAGMPGIWNAKVYWNGSLIFTLPFNILPPAAVDSKVMSAALPVSGGGCQEPPSASIFLPGDPRATAWFYVKNVQAGDHPSIEFYDPDGNVYFNFAWDPVSTGGGWCFWAYIHVANNSPASKFGTWTARVYWNDAPFFEMEFRILPVTTVDHVMTKTVESGTCPAVPPAVTGFMPTDGRAYLWFYVRGAQQTDRPTAEWYAPDGSLYKTSVWELSGGGGRCLWHWIDVAGAPAADLPGNWNVKVLWNGAHLFTLPFSISVVAFENAMLTKSLPAGSGCPVPTPATTFSGADPQAILWFLVKNAKAGDRATGAWYDPNGKVFRTMSWEPLADGGNYCYRSTLSIAGNSPSSLPGAWTVKVLWNDVPLFDLQFTIQDTAGGQVTAASPTGARPAPAAPPGGTVRGEVERAP